jgi:hypothetical protein
MRLSVLGVTLVVCGSDVTAAHVDRMPAGNVRVSKNEFLAVWQYVADHDNWPAVMDEYFMGRHPHLRLARRRGVAHGSAVHAPRRRRDDGHDRRTTEPPDWDASKPDDEKELRHPPDGETRGRTFGSRRSRVS